MSQTSEMVIIIRPSFKKVCGPDACRAGVYNHILYRLAKKAKNEPEKDVREGNIFWFASAEDICQDIDEAWCVNKVRKEVKKLVDDNLLGQRHNPIKKWDRKYQYFLSEEQGKKLLERCEAEGVCLLHIGLNAEVLHLLHMVNAFNKNGGCICQKEEMELPNMGNASTINGGAIPEGSQPKGSTEGSLSEERESPPNTLDSTTVVSSDTARSQFSLIEAIFFLRKHSYTIEPFAQRKDVFVLQYPSGKEVHISAENIITEANAVALGEAFDTAHASLSEIPVTFADCLSYLQEQGVTPRGEDAVEIMVQARTLYAHRHPRYEYRARPGLSEHPDDQLPSKQNEQVFTNDEPQGDDHATAASGHSHRVGEPAAPGGDSDHGTVDNGQVATPEGGPVLEAQEITEGEHHASRVPTLPATNHPTPGECEVSRSGSDHSGGITHPDDGLPAVHPVGRGTSRPQDRAGRARFVSEAEKDAAETLAQKGQTDGNQPCTSRSHPDGSREHMRLPGNSGSRDLGTPYQETLTETPTTSTPAQSLPLPQDAQAASGTPKPLVEPDMSGKWSHEKCVEYAEWCNQKRYTEKMHEEQLKAAASIHKNDGALTLAQFKQAYDERNDPWWKEHKGKLHVNDMKARGASGIDRVHEMLQRIEDAASKCRAQTPRVLVPAPSPNQPITNIRELVRQRELLRQQQAVGV